MFGSDIFPRSAETGSLAVLPPRVVALLADLAREFQAARARGPLRDATWRALERVDRACLRARVSRGDGFAIALAESAVIEAREAVRTATEPDPRQGELFGGGR